MQIKIGTVSIEVPPFISDSMSADNRKQFDAFMASLLKAHANKIRGDISMEAYKKNKADEALKNMRNPNMAWYDDLLNGYGLGGKKHG